MNKHKILLVLYSYDTGGSEVLALSIIQKLDKEKYEPYAISINYNGTLKNRFIRCCKSVHSLKKGDGWSIKGFLEIGYFILKNRINLIHTHHLGQLIYCYPISRMLNVPIIHTEHEKFSFIANPKYLKILRYLVKRTYFTVIGNSVKEFFFNQGKIDNNKIEVIPNGVDFLYFNFKDKINNRKTCYEVTEKYNFRDKLKIGCVGRLTKVKDHVTLIKAFNELIQKYNNICLVIIGDGNESENLKELVKQMGLNNLVYFTGNVSPVVNYLSLLDVFVSSSYEEGLPISIIEAMAMKIPVVSTNVGDIPRIIINGETGLLVPPKDPKNLSKAIATLINSVKLRFNLAEKAYSFVTEAYNINNVVREYEGLYDRALNR